MLKLVPCPITGQDRCEDRECELHYMSAPLLLEGVVRELESTMDIDWSNVDLTLGARIQRGMAYIQRHYPWAVNDVLWGTIDVLDAAKCVLGQIHGHFWRSPENKRATTGWLQAHGFLIPDPIDRDEHERAHRLNLLWQTAFSAWFDR